jgi:hypothetical protein
MWKWKKVSGYIIKILCTIINVTIIMTTIIVAAAIDL